MLDISLESYHKCVTVAVPIIPQFCIVIAPVGYYDTSLYRKHLVSPNIIRYCAVSHYQIHGQVRPGVEYSVYFYCSLLLLIMGLGE